MAAPRVFSVDELARVLGRDRRDVEKMVERGKVPGRRVDGSWQFQANEIRDWIQQEFASYSSTEWEAIESSHQSEEIDQDAPISQLLRIEAIEIPLQARTKRSALERLVALAEGTGQVWSPDLLLKAILEREENMSTALESGIAIPHPKNPMPDAIGESLIAFGRSDNGIPFGGTRGLTDLFFLILTRDNQIHLQVLSRLGRLFHTPGFLDSIRSVESSEEAWHTIAEAERQLV